MFSEDDFDLADIPDEVKKMFEGVCGSRWISFLRQARKLIYRLNIEAPQAMIDFVQKTLKMSNADMGVLCKLNACFHDPSKPSLWCLMFVFIAHHSAGGKNGDTYINGMQLNSFLCSPAHRVALSILSSLYPVQMGWPNFFDGTSLIHPNTSCISTRLTESVIFNRPVKH